MRIPEISKLCLLPHSFSCCDTCLSYHDTRLAVALDLEYRTNDRNTTYIRTHDDLVFEMSVKLPNHTLNLQALFTIQLHPLPKRKGSTIKADRQHDPPYEPSPFPAAATGFPNGRHAQNFQLADDSPLVSRFKQPQPNLGRAYTAGKTDRFVISFLDCSIELYCVL